MQARSEASLLEQTSTQHFAPYESRNSPSRKNHIIRSDVAVKAVRFSSQNTSWFNRDSLLAYSIFRHTNVCRPTLIIICSRRRKPSTSHLAGSSPDVCDLDHGTAAFLV